MSCVHRLLGACTCLALAGGGCADEPAGGGGASADAGREAGPGPGGDGGSPADGGGVEPPPDELTHFYDQLQEDALAYPPVDGDWPDDYGDAPFYGLAFYSRAGETQDDDRYREIARAARDHGAGLVRQANSDLLWFLDHMEEVFMAAFGLLEHADQLGDDGFVADVDQLLDTVNGLVAAMDHYLDPGEGGQYASVYGPTTLTAALALLDLQAALYLGGERRDDRVAAADALFAAIEDRVRDGDRYLYAPGEERLFLYPNAMMMLALARRHQVTGDEAAVARAEEVFEVIQALKDDDKGSYRSPYSAATMGATTDDYSTLSSQNYIAMALLVLHEQSGDTRYRQEAREVLDFSRRWLYDAAQGKVLHHWMDGRLALPEDPEYFCSGCNLQLLYVLWYLQRPR